MFSDLPLRDVRLHIPSVTNRTTGKSMGEGTEDMAKTWHIQREPQDNEHGAAQPSRHHRRAEKRILR